MCELCVVMVSVLCKQTVKTLLVDNVTNILVNEINLYFFQKNLFGSIVNRKKKQLNFGK